MNNALTEFSFENESLLFTMLESSIPKIKSFLIEELDRHEAEHKPKGRVMFNLIFKTKDLLTLNLVEKNYKNGKAINTIICEMITINRIIAPTFFDEMDKIQAHFKKDKELSLEIVKYISKENKNNTVLAVAMTEQDTNGVCESPIDVVSMDIFLKKIINSKR